LNLFQRSAITADRKPGLLGLGDLLYDDRYAILYPSMPS